MRSLTFIAFGSPPPVITTGFAKPCVRQSLAFVKALARPEFLVEMDAIAVVPDYVRR